MPESPDPTVSSTGATEGNTAGGLLDVSQLVDGLVAGLQTLLVPVREFLASASQALVNLLVRTPHPDAVIGAPSNGPWPALHEYYWGQVIPLALTLYGGVLAVVVFFEATSHLFSSYHRSKLKTRAFTGLLGILSWWWIAALGLQVIDSLTRVITPDLTQLSLFETASFASVGALLALVTSLIDLGLLVILATLYLGRELGIYLFVLLMPLLIVLWIPGIGPLAPVSALMRRLGSFFVPLAFMTVPVAGLFRVASLLGHSADLSLGGLGQWLTAITVPLLATVLPLVLFWQTGAIARTGRQVASGMSIRNGRQRAARVQTVHERQRAARQNLVQGYRDESQERANGQDRSQASASRARRVGTRLNGYLSRSTGPSESTPVEDRSTRTESDSVDREHPSPEGGDPSSDDRQQQTALDLMEQGERSDNTSSEGWVARGPLDEDGPDDGELTDTQPVPPDDPPTDRSTDPVPDEVRNQEASDDE